MKSTHKKLRQIAKANGFKIRAGAEFKIVFFGATITVDNKIGPRIWEWRMLHELGHAELILKHERCHIKTLVRMLNMPDYRPTEAFYRDYLDMEWKAWEQGLKIAKREGININEAQYWRHAENCWQTYVKHLRSIFE